MARKEEGSIAEEAKKIIRQYSKGMIDKREFIYRMRILGFEPWEIMIEEVHNRPSHKIS